MGEKKNKIATVLFVVWGILFGMFMADATYSLMVNAPRSMLYNMLPHVVFSVLLFSQAAIGVVIAILIFVFSATKKY